VGGDGSPLSTQDVTGAKLLLHEATFLASEDRAVDDEEEGTVDGHATFTPQSKKLARDAGSRR
jgi:ribonuclease BN (tRNA processing enzyme)